MDPLDRLGELEKNPVPLVPVAPHPSQWRWSKRHLVPAAFRTPIFTKPGFLELNRISGLALGHRYLVNALATSRPSCDHMIPFSTKPMSSFNSALEPWYNSVCPLAACMN
ncbi:unnamed protein product [Protopolystoma xenopodis]|uniref:Uncharacterized protein n=1 Tax=Protopolystoma xenopodis TaxID=117903 RepID=A0A3S5B7D3_9PLAT|nr:unnamed protein product [Protopolystoma xenopodis]